MAPLTIVLIVYGGCAALTAVLYAILAFVGASLSPGNGILLALEGIVVALLWPVTLFILLGIFLWRPD